MRTESRDPFYWRFQAPHRNLASPFGTDWFGALAERIARFSGTPQYIIGQSVVVIVWIVANGVLFLTSFDPYPFILLNLTFSLQAAYASPFILLAQTRQAERDKAWSDADARHRQELADTGLQLLQQNTALTLLFAGGTEAPPIGAISRFDRARQYGAGCAS
jgi:uncharacterized membrane protein